MTAQKPHFGLRTAVMLAKQTILGIHQVTVAARALEILLILKIFISFMVVMCLWVTCRCQSIR